MANLKILHNTVEASANLTADASAGSLLPINLLNDEPTYIWRSTGTSGTLTLTWSTPVSVDSVALCWTNLTDTDTVTANLFTQEADVTPAATLELSPPTATRAPHGKVDMAFWFGNDIPVRKVTLVVIDVANPSPVEAGRVFVGKAHEMYLNPAVGAALSVEDPSYVSRSESGAIRVEKRKPYRRLAFNYAALHHADSLELFTLFRNMGPKVALFSVLPDRSNDLSAAFTLVGFISGTRSLVSSPAARFNASLEVTEIC